LTLPSDLVRLPTSVDVERKLDYVFGATKLTRTLLNGKVPLIGLVVPHGL